MNQKKMDQLIVQAKRRHKIKMEKLGLAFLGKRAEQENIDGTGNYPRRTQQAT